MIVVMAISSSYYHRSDVAPITRGTLFHPDHQWYTVAVTYFVVVRPVPFRGHW